MTRMKLIDTYTLGSEGVFEGFDTADIISSPELVSLDYYYGRSGDKYVAPIYNKFLELSDGDCDMVNSALAELLLNKYSVKWLRIKEALLNSTYSPLTDYEHTETKSGTTNDTTKYGSSVANEGKVSSKETTSRSVENDTSTYGFNSSLSVPTSESSGTVSETVTGNADDNTSESTSTKSGTDTKDNTYSETIEQSGRKESGAELITKELDVRSRNIYLDIIYKDIDSMIALSIY